MLLRYVTTVVLVAAVVTAIPTSTRRNKQKHPNSNDDHTEGSVSSHFKIYGDSPLGCKELRSKKYLSDGSCTSTKPITEVVCAGICLPVAKLPWYSEYVNLWYNKRHQSASRTGLATEESSHNQYWKMDEPWQCVDDVIKRKRVHLQCQDGTQRVYVVKTVRSCKCKKRKRDQNDIKKH